MTDNVVHFVLARPEGAGPGTKGLSLFIVPKFHVDLETGELGERNGVYVTNVEKKMGLKVSTTCELTFGEKEPAVGTLLGDVHDGIAQMFRVIENARMLVGTKAIATLSTGYLNALEYAKQRVQGADLTQMTDKAAPRVTITHHPDVRRSLMLQKAYAEGLRALVLFTATQQDIVDQEHLETGSEEIVQGLAGRDGQPGQRPAAADRQGPRLGAGLGAPRDRVAADRSAARASSRSTRSSSTSGTPRSTPSTRARRRSRAGLLLPQDHPRQGAGADCHRRCRSRSSPRTSAPRVAPRPERELLGRASRTSRASSARWSGRSWKSDPRHGWRPDQPLQGRPEHHPPAAGRRRPRRRLAAAASGRRRPGRPRCPPRARTRTSTPARSPPPSSSPQVLPRLAAERAIAEATDNALMDVPESAF
jgi:hypothetical protein